jgi:hypothetical protein
MTHITVLITRKLKSGSWPFAAGCWLLAKSRVHDRLKIGFESEQIKRETGFKSFRFCPLVPPL